MERKREASVPLRELGFARALVAYQRDLHSGDAPIARRATRAYSRTAHHVPLQNASIKQLLQRRPLLRRHHEDVRNELAQLPISATRDLSNETTAGPWWRSCGPGADSAVHLGRHVRIRLVEGREAAREDLLAHLRDCVGGEGGARGEQLIQQTAHRPHVGLVRVRLPLAAFGRYLPRRPQLDATSRNGRSTGRA